MAKFVVAAKKFAAAEEGATMVEYGIMIALIAAICVGVVTTIGTKVSTAFKTVADAL
jgi:pilus assembly protein Flp/PilA